MIGSVHPSVRITNANPNARHRGSNGCFDLVLAPVVLLATVAMIFWKRTR